mmetsp:Transcript_56123/g.109866  ORF Transcript_56123/g.109866 Transcript_56123/m.109866 type:complete len:233 (+) Transcript_56123:213-911(+)
MLRRMFFVAVLCVCADAFVLSRRRHQEAGSRGASLRQERPATSLSLLESGVEPLELLGSAASAFTDSSNVLGDSLLLSQLSGQQSGLGDAVRNLVIVFFNSPLKVWFPMVVGLLPISVVVWKLQRNELMEKAEQASIQAEGGRQDAVFRRGPLPKYQNEVIKSVDGQKIEEVRMIEYGAEPSRKKKKRRERGTGRAESTTAAEGSEDPVRKKKKMVKRKKKVDKTSGGPPSL